jgi:aerobic-type carbon monoxide dehydrogenase small subunit (CoxS/CutS family)
MIGAEPSPSAIRIVCPAFHPTRAEIAKQMKTNLCRCGTYNRIVAAVERAAREA